MFLQNAESGATGVHLLSQDVWLGLAGVGAGAYT
jgi:hypothetical protein